MIMQLAEPQHMQVLSDGDVIALRQAIRQRARAVGLGPAQQARITAAISEVARALLYGAGAGQFTIRIETGIGNRPAFEILCAPGHGGNSTDARPIYALPAVAEARALVDDTWVKSGSEGDQLLMRMWLVSSP
ncbi:MAG: hypothetical protein AB4911_11055 [Oscillochloridaceae bacterium umkhey_bin13]